MSDDINEPALGNDTEASNDAPALTETEQLAQEMGWRPEAEFTGPKERWKPAKDFILAEREISRSMKQDVKKLRDTVDRMASASSKQTEKMLQQQADEYERRFAEAVENKDVRGAAEAAKGMRELQESARAPVADVEADFARANSWYGKDADATAVAIAKSQQLAAQGKSVDEQLEGAVAAVKRAFPDLFADGEKPKAKEPPQLHAPARGASTKRAKTFADLPPDVKRAAESHAKLAASRFGADAEKTKAEYAADYWADQAA